MNVRDRTVKIKTIYPEPKELADKKDYKVFSYGIKLDDDTYINISGTAKDIDSFKNKAEKKFYVSKDEKIEEGKTYKVYEESTDKENKYWNVKSFVKINGIPDPHFANKSDEELAKEYETMGESKNGGGLLPNPIEKSLQDIAKSLKDIKDILNTRLK